MKFTKSEIENYISEKSLELVKRRNPYKEKAIKYAVGGEPRYIYNGESYTEEDIDATYLITVKKDMLRGYEERMVGYYDKWFRYNHADEGAAYDEGQKLATKNPKCSGEFNIIPCGEL